MNAVALVLAALVAAAGFPAATVTVSDGQGAPIAGASVTFSDTTGGVDRERTNAAGQAVARSDFFAIAADLSASGYQPLLVALQSRYASVTLVRDPKVVGVIRVATGTPRDTHELPVAASFLDKLDLRTSPALTSDALFQTLPGFDRTRSNSAFTNYGQLRVSFNGAGNDRGLVLVDGVPAQDGFGGQVDWAAYPAQMIERAEILRGAGSALYGPGAVGGVLNISTIDGNAPGLAGLVSYAVGSRGADIADLQFSARVTSNAAFSLFTNRWRATYFDLPRDFSSPIDSAATSNSNVTLAQMKFGSATATGRFSVMNADDDQFEGRPNYLQSRSLTQYAGELARQSQRSLLDITAFARDAFVINVADKYPTAPGVMRYTQNVPTAENGASVAWIVSSGANDFQARFDGRNVWGANYQYFPSGKLQNSGSGSQWLAGLALQETLRHGRFEMLAGTRLDDVSSFGESRVAIAGAGKYKATYPSNRYYGAVSPRVALRYDVSPEVALRFSDGAGFRPPYLNELVRGFQIGATVYTPNPNLIPERSETKSGGVSAFLGTGSLDLNVFSTRVNDAIAFVTLASNLQMRSNLARTQTDGSTLEYTVPLGGCVRGRALLTHQYARVTAGPPATIGKRLQFVPDTTASVGIDGDAGHLQVGTDLTFVGLTFADDLNTEPLDSALLIGFRISAPVSRNSSLSVSGENVTNRQYLSSVDRIGLPSIYSLRWETRFGSGGEALPATAAACNS